MEKFSKSRIWDKVPKSSTLVLEGPKFSSNIGQDRLKEAPTAKISSVPSAIFD